jgi:hypothetical protein
MQTILVNKQKGNKMKTNKYFLIAAIVLLFAGNIYSQNGWGPGSKYNMMYDTKTIETVNGSVISIDQVSPDKNMSAGIHLILNTGNGNITIHLGPAWFIDNQDIKINKDDNISVTGSRVSYNGDQIIIAKEVIKGDQNLKLRDDNGYPMWSGWRNN